jgi:hypothetical protein
MKDLWNDNWQRKVEVRREGPAQGDFVHHKTHKDYHEIEPGTPWYLSERFKTLHNDDLYRQFLVVILAESRRSRGVVRVARMGETDNSYRMLVVGKLLKNRSGYGRMPLR